MNTSTYLALIEKVAQNARTGWFALLSLLVFVGVILMSHSDIDFFAYGTETRLPLINLSVPTVSFFVAAPGLIVALYTYLHIYLTSLWRILADLPERIDGDLPEKYVYPALVCIFALRLRHWLSKSDQFTLEGRTIAVVTISFSVTWLFGPVVVGSLWWLSTTYHNPLLTLWNGLCLWIMMSVGLVNLLDLISVSQFGSKSLLRHYRATHRRVDMTLKLSLTLSAVVLSLFSWTTTKGGLYEYQEYNQEESVNPTNSFVQAANRIFSLVSADLTRAELSRKPQHWKSYENWSIDWRQKFLNREAISSQIPTGQWPDDLFWKYRKEIVSRWLDSTSSLKSPKLDRVDLRTANMEFAFLSGADLRGAKLEGGRLIRAHIEGVNFRGAYLNGAEVIGARAQGADFSGAQLRGARFFRAQMQGANFYRARARSVDFREARLQFANLSWAEMERAEFHSARMLGADLSWASLQDAVFMTSKMQYANLTGARLQRALLFGAKLHRAIIVGAHMQGADLSDAQLVEVDFREAEMEDVDVSGARIERCNFRAVDLSKVRNLTQNHVDMSFGTRLTKLPSGLARPCHWDSKIFYWIRGGPGVQGVASQGCDQCASICRRWVSLGVCAPEEDGYVVR